MLRREILKNLSGLHDQWSSILREAKLVAREMNMVILLGSTFKQRKPIRGLGASYDKKIPSMDGESNEETNFHREVFYTSIAIWCLTFMKLHDWQIIIAFYPV